jgi:hypothetical protein
LLLGGILGELSAVLAEMSSKHAESQRSKTNEFGLGNTGKYGAQYSQKRVLKGVKSEESAMTV